MKRQGLPALMQAMLAPVFYPHPVATVELIQTHISWVFLAGDFAYKVKKPVDFGFLDFTTPDRRKYYCGRELELNRRLSPELYLEVLSICCQAGTYSLGGAGKPIEYCLKMVRFAQADVLDQRLSHGNFEPEWMDALASDVARFHGRAETSESIQRFGGIAFLQGHIETIFRVARQHLGEVISPDELARLEAHSAEFIKVHAGAYKRRQKEGFIRSCHGDLHLKNIALYEGHPRIFDCVEFNDEFRMIDTMNDAAFLVMDCIARGHPDLAYRFLSRYLEQTGDYAGLHLLPQYLTYRAGVRGKVACLLAADSHLDNGQRQKQLHEAHHYFKLAPSFVDMPAPCLFVIGGLSGSGKSHLSLIGAGKVPAVVIRSDATRKHLARYYPGLPLYGTQMNAKAYGAMIEAGRAVLEAGFSAILDATFLRRRDRDKARNMATQLNVDSHLLWLDMDAKTLRQRIQRRGRADVSDADITVLERQLARYRHPSEPDVQFLKDSGTWPY